MRMIAPQSATEHFTGTLFKNSLKLLAALSLTALPFMTFGQSLTQSIQYSVDNNPDVRQQVAQRYAFNEVVKQAKADYLPVVDLNLGIGKEHTRFPAPISRLTATGRTSVTLTRREAGLVLTENLFKGFNTRNEVIRTAQESIASGFAISGVASDLALNVSEQYLNVILQQRLVKLADDNLSAHRHIFAMIKERKVAGLTKEADVFQAQSRLSLAESNVTSANSNLEDAKTRFERFVRMPATHLGMPQLPTRAQLPHSKAKVLAVALRDHPTLKSAEADLKATVAQHKASKFTNYPQLDLVLDANRNHNMEGTPGLDHDESAMLQLHYNLFAGGLHVAEQRETAFQIAEARSVRNRTILEIEETVSLSWTALLAEQKRADQLRQYQASALKTLKAYKEQYKLGKRTLLDLLDSQNEYYQSQVEYKKARFSEFFARYRILNSMGTLLGYLHIVLPHAAAVAGFHPDDLTVMDVQHTATGIGGDHHPVYAPTPEELARVDHSVSSTMPQGYVRSYTGTALVRSKTAARMSDDHARYDTAGEPYHHTPWATRERAKAKAKHFGYAKAGKLNAKHSLASLKKAGKLGKPGKIWVIAKTESVKPAKGVSTAQTTSKVSAIPSSIEKKQADKIAEVSKVATVTTATPANSETKVAQVKPVTSIMQVNPNYYTLQIVADRDEVALKQFIVSNHLQNKATYFSTQSGSKAWHMLVYGTYPTQKSASKALSNLPTVLKRLNPWVRSYASIQSDIARNTPHQVA